MIPSCTNVLPSFLLTSFLDRNVALAQQHLNINFSRLRAPRPSFGACESGKFGDDGSTKFSLKKPNYLTELSSHFFAPFLCMIQVLF